MLRFDVFLVLVGLFQYSNLVKDQVALSTKALTFSQRCQIHTDTTYGVEKKSIKIEPQTQSLK